jgi:protein PsiE
MTATKFIKHAEKIGHQLVEGFHLFALFIIGATIVWSAGYTYLAIMDHGRATLQEILVLFIYLELGAMVGTYFKTNRLPVRYLLYIGITALTRSLVVDVEAERIHILLVVTGAILLLALAIVVLGYGTSKFAADDANVGDRRLKTD